MIITQFLQADGTKQLTDMAQMAVKCIQYGQITYHRRKKNKR
jgi:hypothetical protein